MSLVTNTKQLNGIMHLLRHDMGMSSSAAAATAWKWQKHRSQNAYISTFLHAAIEHQIDTYRNQSFAKFNMAIAVYPAAGAQPIELQLPELGTVVVGYDEYVFGPQHNSEPSKSMRVRLSRRGIQVGFCQNWRSIAAYLDEVSTKLNYQLKGQFALERQFHWWKVNGKSFNIMALPGELRNSIFDQILPSEARPFPASKCRRLPPSEIRKLPPSHASFMCINKQLYSEASARFYQTTPFLIEHRQLLSRTLRPKIICERMRHLRLKLTHDEYLDLFHFNSEGPQTYIRQPLRELSLTGLELHISRPSQISQRPWLEGACHRAKVGLIFATAWASIKGHPITITGYVKDSQKAALEARLQHEKAAFDKWVALKMASGGGSSTLRQYDEFVKEVEEQNHGGVRLDGKTWEDVEQESSLAPFLVTSLDCTCQTPCAAEGWTAED